MAYLIDRQEVLNLIDKDANGLFARQTDIGILKDEIYSLPSVIPTERTGYWIEKDGYLECSNCGGLPPSIEWGNSVFWKRSKYCPDCGARMIENDL